MPWRTRSGDRLHAAVVRVMGRFHRHPAGDVERSVVSFGQRTRATVSSQGPGLLLSNLAWALGNAAVLLMAMRFSGLDSSDGPAGHGPAGLRLPDGGQHPADPRQERPGGTDPVHDHEPDQRCRPVGHDRSDPALPGRDLAAADARRRADVPRLALPGPPRHGHHRARGPRHRSPPPRTASAGGGPAVPGHPQRHEDHQQDAGTTGPRRGPGSAGASSRGPRSRAGRCRTARGRPRPPR